MIQEHKVNFLAGIVRLNLIHGIQLTEPDYVELAFLAWDKINTKALSLYKIEVTLTDNIIALPCNYEYVEAVITDKFHCRCNDHNGYSDYLSTYLKEHSTKPFNSDLYNINGEFVNYDIQNSSIVFLNDDFSKMKGSKVTIYYKGVKSDSDGFPLLTERQAEAISYYCAYIVNHRKLMQGTGDSNLVTYLKQEWLQKCNQARVTSHMTQNAFDKILDAQFSWTRKRWNKAHIV